MHPDEEVYIPDPQELVRQHQQINQAASRELERVEARAMVLRNVIRMSGATIEAHERTMMEQGGSPENAIAGGPMTVKPYVG